eukprot:6704483-Pyramimonas_sp.AAC.1
MHRCAAARNMLRRMRKNCYGTNKCVALEIQAARHYLTRTLAFYRQISGKWGPPLDEQSPYWHTESSQQPSSQPPLQSDPYECTLVYCNFTCVGCQ